MMTKKKTYVQPRIEEYDIQPCVPLAVSVSSELKGDAKEKLEDDSEIEW